MSTAAQRASWFPARVVALCRALKLPEEGEKGALYVTSDDDGRLWQVRQRTGPGAYDPITTWFTERELSAWLDGAAAVAAHRIRRPSRIRKVERA